MRMARRLSASSRSRSRADMIGRSAIEPSIDAERGIVLCGLRAADKEAVGCVGVEGPMAVDDDSWTLCSRMPGKGLELSRLSCSERLMAFDVDMGRETEDEIVGVCVLLLLVLVVLVVVVVAVVWDAGTADAEIELEIGAELADTELNDVVEVTNSVGSCCGCCGCCCCGCGCC